MPEAECLGGRGTGAGVRGHPGQHEINHGPLSSSEPGINMTSQLLLLSVSALISYMFHVH